MQEKEENPENEKLLILPLGEESKKITKVISNDTARQIIELLADAPLSASDIAERLKAPLTTITYNLENLERVGLVKIERIRYSEKGREVKIYAPVRKLIVVVPEKTDKKSVVDVLRRYIGVFLIVVLTSSLIEFFTKNIRSAKITEASKSALPMPVTTPTPVAVLNETTKGGELYNGMSTPTPTPMPSVTIESTQPAAMNASPTMMPTPTVSAPDILTKIIDTIIVHPGLMFFLGCLFGVALLIIIDHRRRS